MPEQITLPIKGMTCASCVSHVQRALSQIEGVSEAAVNLATEQATVTFAPELVSLQSLGQSVRDATGPIAVKLPVPEQISPVVRILKLADSRVSQTRLPFLPILPK